MSDNRPSVYVEGNRTVFRASAVGGCVRALVAARLGYDPMPWDDASELRMGEGNLHEPAIVEWLEHDGWTVTDQQKLIELTVGGTIVIRGHIDGVGRHTGPSRLVEIKAMGEDPFKRWVADRFASNDRYAWQVSTYMHALDIPGLFVVKNRNSGAVDVFEVDEAPIPLAKIKARVAQIEAIARRGDFPECDTAYLWNCPYRYLHDQKELAGIGTSEVDDAEVDALAAAYDRARTQATQADTMKKIARDRLADVVRDRKKVRTGRWSVSCSLQARTAIDMAKLKAEVDVTPYKVTTEAETVRVTEVKEKVR